MGVRDTVVKMARQHSGSVQRFAPQALMLAMQGQPLNTASEAGVLRTEEPSMFTTVEDLAKEEVTCMNLQVLYAVGKDPTPARRLANAQFLHRELPVRLSQRAVELMNLPHGLSDMPGIQQVYNCYARYAWELYRTELPSNSQEEYEFSCLLSSILLDAQSIPRALSIGLQDFHNRCFSAKKVQRNSGGREVLNGQRLMEIDPAVRADVQDAISRFYTGRIGVRFLVEHHVSTMPPARHRPGWSGVIKSAVCPSIEARWASLAVRDLCTRHLGAAPDVLVLGNDDDTFTYIPSHLEMMLSEQLMNACRAVVERHHPAYKAMTKLAGPVASWGEEECRKVVEEARAMQRSSVGRPIIPPIKITVALGQHDVTIKIADEGGGASRSEMEQLWTYYYTTANKHLVEYPSPLPTEMTGARGSSDGGISEATGELQDPSPLAGFGIGLPLSRVYARYFGGEVLLKSMEGFGMDSYLHLNRLGYNCEELPPLVRQTCV